ncbi:hypothetical protein [Lacicoccus alkaliphilus]|uniref:PH domain-containing protein n=1 Tax=Lacicoccus alkaliphilus DSM 16010 TaxID=1123231 RepID=A0A1M7E665_9BACL|nr:hypothetical protein [Salinicoccus alkaliphilus]SHL87234.1 PH domain-containing protein [Salinicoccus alkaliphilus DSM 16010]
MDLTVIEEHELYPTEKIGPALQGTLIYKVGGQTEFEGAYITTSERLIMSVDMNGEPYKRVFSYQDIVRVFAEQDALFLEFPEGMGKIAMIDITKGDRQEFTDFVGGKLS